MLCNSSEDLEKYFLTSASQNKRQWGGNPSCFLISKRKDPQYLRSDDQILNQEVDI